MFQSQAEACSTRSSLEISLCSIPRKTDVSPAVNAQTSSALSATCGSRAWHWTRLTLQRCEILPSAHSKCIFLSELSLQLHKSQEQSPLLTIAELLFFKLMIIGCYSPLLIFKNVFFIIFKKYFWFSFFSLKWKKINNSVTPVWHWQSLWWHSGIREGCYQFLALALVMLCLCHWELVTLVAQDRCHLAVREMWDVQPWPEARRVLYRQEGAPQGVRCLLALVSLVLTSSPLDRDMTTSWHAPVPTLLHHSARVHCSFLQGLLRIGKNIIPVCAMP